MKYIFRHISYGEHMHKPCPLDWYYFTSYHIQERITVLLHCFFHLSQHTTQNTLMLPNFSVVIVTLLLCTF
jgi:hypothetical protein